MTSISKAENRDRKIKNRKKIRPMINNNSSLLKKKQKKQDSKLRKARLEKEKYLENII